MMTFFHNTSLGQLDPTLEALRQQEIERLRWTIRLIASEGLLTKPLIEALEGLHGLKYSEGRPYIWEGGRRVPKDDRFYQGQGNINQFELSAINDALTLFAGPHANEWHANLQVPSGAYANLIVYRHIAKRLAGKLEAEGNRKLRILALRLTEGGHLSHGAPVSETSDLYEFFYYGVGDDYKFDLEVIEQLAENHKVDLIVCGASAYMHQIPFVEFGRIARKVGALLLTDIAHIAGLVAGKVHDSPIPEADYVTLTTHKSLLGPKGAIVLCRLDQGESLDKLIFPGTQGGPDVHALIRIAVCLKQALHPEFQQYAHQIIKNAQALAAAFQKQGVYIEGGGTENHMIIINVTEGELNFRFSSRLVKALEIAGLVCNSNSVKGDKGGEYTRGVRVGTVIVTALGMKESHMVQIVDFFMRVTDAHLGGGKFDENQLQQINADVRSFMELFPPPGYVETA